MEHHMFQRYGMMFEEDCDVMDAALSELCPKAEVRVCEIGTYSGHTARGMKKFLEDRGSTIRYWGVEPSLLLHDECPDPFPGAVMIRAKSEEGFYLVPGLLDLVFVDGNHSRNGVILDTYNFFTKVVKGGFMLYHDTNPQSQRTGYEYSGPEIPEFGICVNEALELIGFPWEPWFLFMEKYPLDHHQNGMRAYRNGKP